MEIITSVKNDIIRQTIDVRDNPKDKLFLENLKMINDCFLAGNKILYSLIDKNKSEQIFASYPFLKTFKYYLVSENVIESLSKVRTPQGIVCVFEFLQDKKLNLQENFICLDNLQDPGNVGTIIRSASGTSFKNIFLINCVNILNQKVIRSSMGGIFKQNFKTFENDAQFLEFIKSNKLNYLVADMQGENLFNSKFDISPLGIVVGSEGNGVSQLLKDNAFATISIPMKNGLESLNAGVSCSLIIYTLDNK